MLTGKKILLRAIEKDDLSQLMFWRNSPELRKYFREFRDLSKQDQQEWYENIVLSKNSVLMFSIVRQDNCELIGACGLCDIDWLHRSAELSIYIGIDNVYLDDIYAIDAAKAVINYGFKEIGLHRVWSEVYSHDMKKQYFFQILGFKQDGRLRESHWTNGAWVDSIYYSLLESDKFDDHA